MHSALMINYKALLIEDVVRYVSGHLIIFFAQRHTVNPLLRGEVGFQPLFFGGGRGLTEIWDG